MMDSAEDIIFYEENRAGAKVCASCHATEQSPSGLRDDAGNEKPLEFPKQYQCFLCMIVHLLQYGERTFKAGP